ncbi:hypothetical protein TCAL_10075 [Tigriopus californicus]|uniref:GDP-fucose pyrophosphorylase domain-containing protein n=1 Tax=Tigriopus californicus TaxID=6832 RepID=A0A553N7M0_TIGCA|nr:fucose-1-phosphate guanylyltransferase-like [Tigriopus californicus]TRY61403.1 hypothetical protein TCAL_10075 [Tigriopus californicus]|eukprot:TCALIF_10075-PA protein Name:"Similar to FPGT Fucose-1-phosphate guanylyltransferase (Homo sapiens)" AED:0.05 eAED:0.07 QI:0/-1/0/1/-1/1/1/0/581
MSSDACSIVAQEDGDSALLVTLYDRISHYKRLRGQSPQEIGIPFWDIIVISAGDHIQSEVISGFLINLGNRNLLMKGVTYKVYPDPDGQRVGDGGATLNVVKRLMEDFGDNVFEQRILLIHAGGFSKRIPHLSFITKLFCPIPFGLQSDAQDENHSTSNLTMFDLKQAMYLRFLDTFSSGIFAAASDDIESFIDSPEDFQRFKADLDQLNPDEPALFSLAHPSQLQIGKNHGVFSLSKASFDALQSTSMLLIRDCLKVVQKPTIEEMKARNLVISSNNEDIVYTDSAYWMNAPLVKRLADFALSQSSANEEFSMYSDFMTRQSGKEAPISTIEEPNHSSIQPLLDMATKVPIYLIALPQSKFYHLGTTNEYLDMVQKCLMIQKATTKLEIDDKSLENFQARRSFISCSDLPAQVFIPHGCVLDHTVISTNTIQLRPKTILSNCHIPMDIGEIEIPGEYVYATVPVELKSDATQKSTPGFVTKITHINEDVKGVYDSLVDVQGKTMVRLPSHVSFTNDCFSLWNAKIFPMETDKCQSFLASFRTFFSGKELILEADTAYFSCDDLMKMRSKSRIVQEFSLYK